MAEDEGFVDISGDGGCLKKILVEGTGEQCPDRGVEVEVHYTGTLHDGGDKFDSSRDRDETFKFAIGKGSVIKGCDTGVASMKIGEKCILRCNSDYAYGDSGSPPKIPGGATLNFEVRPAATEPYFPSSPALCVAADPCFQCGLLVGSDLCRWSSSASRSRTTELSAHLYTA